MWGESGAPCRWFIINVVIAIVIIIIVTTITAIAAMIDDHHIQDVAKASPAPKECPSVLTSPSCDCTMLSTTTFKYF